MRHLLTAVLLLCTLSAHAQIKLWPHQIEQPAGVVVFEASRSYDYPVGQFVSHNGAIYKAISATTTTPPSAAWELLAANVDTEILADDLVGGDIYPAHSVVRDSDTGLLYRAAIAASTFDPNGVAWFPIDNVLNAGEVQAYEADAIALAAIDDAIGSLYVLASGQSNMDGNSTGGDVTVNPKVFVWDQNAAQFEVATIGEEPFETVNGYNNLAFHFCKKLQEETGKKVYLVFSAQGSQSIDEWVPETGAQWSTLIGRANASGVVKFDAFLWHQGEQDNASTNAVYEVKYDSLKAQLRRQVWFPETTPIIIGELYDGSVGGQNGFITTVNGDDDVWDAFASATGLNDAGDGVHFSGGALEILGRERYWEAYKSLPLYASAGSTDNLSNSDLTITAERELDLNNNDLYMTGLGRLILGYDIGNTISSYKVNIKAASSQGGIYAEANTSSVGNYIYQKGTGIGLQVFSSSSGLPLNVIGAGSSGSTTSGRVIKMTRQAAVSDDVNVMAEYSTSTGTAEIGFGAYTNLLLENASGTASNAARWGVRWDDPTLATLKSTLFFNTRGVTNEEGSQLELHGDFGDGEERAVFQGKVTSTGVMRASDGVDASDVTTVNQLYSDGPINPKHYGAIADGTTNDYTALTNAIAAASSSGRILDLQGASYKTFTILDVPANVTIVNGTMVLADERAAFDITGDGVTIRDVTFDCLAMTSSTANPENQSALHADGVSDLKVINCTFQGGASDAAKSGRYGLYVANSTDVYVNNCDFFNFTLWGNYFLATSDLIVESCRSYNNAYDGFKLAGNESGAVAETSNVQFIDCIGYNNDRDGLDMALNFGVNLAVIGGQFYSNELRGVDLKNVYQDGDVSEVTIQGAIIRSNNDGGINVQGGVGNTELSRINISNNKLTKTSIADFGIRLQDATGVVKDNEINGYQYGMRLIATLTDAERGQESGKLLIEGNDIILPSIGILIESQSEGELRNFVIRKNNIETINSNLYRFDHLDGSNVGLIAGQITSNTGLAGNNQYSWNDLNGASSLPASGTVEVTYDRQLLGTVTSTPVSTRGTPGDYYQTSDVYGTVGYAATTRSGSSSWEAMASSPDNMGDNDAGGNVVSNMADGVELDDAATVGQLNGAVTVFLSDEVAADATDQTAAIQVVITATATNKQTLVIDDDYIARGLTVPANSTIEILEGFGITDTDATGNADVISITGDNVTIYGGGYLEGPRQYYIDNSLTNNDFNHHVIDADEVDNLSISGITIRNALAYGIRVHRSNDLKIDDVKFIDFGLSFIGVVNGIFVGGAYANRPSITNCVFTNMNWDEGADNDADGIQILGNETSTYGTINDVVIEGNTFYQVDKRGVKMQDAKGARVANNNLDYAEAFISLAANDSISDVTVFENVISNVERGFSGGVVSGSQVIINTKIFDNQIADCSSHMVESSGNIIWEGLHVYDNIGTDVESIGRFRAKDMFYYDNDISITGSGFKMLFFADAQAGITPNNHDIRDNIFRSSGSINGYNYPGTIIDKIIVGNQWDIPNTNGTNVHNSSTYAGDNTVVLDKAKSAKMTQYVGASIPYYNPYFGTDVDFGGDLVTSGAFTFSGDTDNYISRTGSNQISITSNNSRNTQFDVSSTTFYRQTRHQDGTESAPSLSFTNDTNSGIYSVGADQIGVSVGGSKKVQFNDTNTEFSHEIDMGGNAVTGMEAADASGEAVEYSQWVEGYTPTFTSLTTSGNATYNAPNTPARSYVSITTAAMDTLFLSAPDYSGQTMEITYERLSNSDAGPVFVSVNSSNQGEAIHVGERVLYRGLGGGWIHSPIFKPAETQRFAASTTQVDTIFPNMGAVYFIDAENAAGPMQIRINNETVGYTDPPESATTIEEGESFYIHYFGAADNSITFSVVNDDGNGKNLYFTDPTGSLTMVRTNEDYTILKLTRRNTTGADAGYDVVQHRNF